MVSNLYVLHSLIGGLMFLGAIIFAADKTTPGYSLGGGFVLVIIAAIFSFAAGTVMVLIAKEP